MKTVLIVDDDIAVTNYFGVLLTQTERFEPVVVNDSREVPALLATRRFDVVLLDMDMPDVSGLDILKLVRDQRVRSPVIVLTGVGDVELAVRAMKLGAFDYLTKPVEEEHLVDVLDQALEHSALHRTLSELPQELRREDLTHGTAFAGFVTQDARMIRVLHEADRIAAGDLAVFISGEGGTPREPLARAMHQASARAGRRFATLDAAAVKPRDLGAILFGQARVWGGPQQDHPGLLEETAGGTLFIDNVDHLGLPVQLRLKRFLQSCEFYRENSTNVLLADVRVMVAAALDPKPGQLGSFSPDLLHHLMVNTLHIPPLRERRVDIPLLIEDLSQREAARAGGALRVLSPECRQALLDYDFPGNDVELAAIVSNALSRSEADPIGLEALPSYIRALKADGASSSIRSGARAAFEPRRLVDVERDYVLGMIGHCGGDTARAAAELGISLDQLEAIVGGGAEA